MKKYFMSSGLMAIALLLAYINFSLLNIKYVSATVMQKQHYVPQINVSGEFISKDSTVISMEYPLCIKEVFVKEGEDVVRGQALFSIDKNKMMRIVKGEETIDMAVYSSYSDITKYRSTLSDTDFLTTLPDMVYSSCYGVVNSMNIAPDSISLPDEQLLSIVSSDGILAKFSLSQIDYGKISIGDSVKITPVAFSNSSYNGKISADSAIVKKQSSLSGNKVVVDVFASIENPDNKIADGLQVNGTVNIGQPYDISGLNYQYIYQDENGQYVLIYNKGIAQKQYVETGVETENFTQLMTEFTQDTIFLKGDIKEGDKVIITYN